MLGPQCCENPPKLMSSAYGEGSVIELGGLDSYVSGSSHSYLAVLLISDVYGNPIAQISFTCFRAPNLRKLADKIALAGYYVVVPDFFDGDYFGGQGDNRSLADWVNCHETAKGAEDAKLVIEGLWSKGISAVGAAGFCWGGKVVARLANSNYIQAAILLHPAMVTIDDIKEVKVPIAILGAEIDKLSPSKLIKQFEEVLSTKPEVDSYVKIFPGTKHGWTMRYKDEDKMEIKRAEEAHGNLLAWLNKHLKVRRISKF